MAQPAERNGDDYVAWGIAQLTRYGNRIVMTELAGTEPLSTAVRNRLLAESAVLGAVLDPEFDDPVQQLKRNPRNRPVSLW